MKHIVKTDSNNYVIGLVLANNNPSAVVVPDEVFTSQYQNCYKYISGKFSFDEKKKEEYDSLANREELKRKRKPILEAVNIYRNDVVYGVITEEDEVHDSIVAWYNSLLNLNESAFSNIPNVIIQYGKDYGLFEVKNEEQPVVEKLTLVENPDISVSHEFKCSFISNDNEFTGITIDANNFLYYMKGDAQFGAFDGKSWKTDEYRVLKLLEEPGNDFASWLKENRE